MILLRAVVAPLYLIATVIFSLFATLGVTAFVFTQIFGDAGFDTSLPTYAFIFLVALGVDYNIFLMSRVREEARDLPTREAVVRALAATGPVITSAGIILAGTFAVLASLPVTFLLHLGFAVSFGVLLDTFIVRTIMVPAIAELVGDASWWPSGRKSKGLVARRRARAGAAARVGTSCRSAEADRMRPEKHRCGTDGGCRGGRAPR